MSASEQLRDLVNLADALIAVLPERKRAEYRARLSEYRAAPRSKEPLYCKVIQLFEDKKPLTASEITEKLIDDGVNVEKKQVFNAIDYLIRMGRVRRETSGVYYLLDYGAVIVTSDDLGGNGGICE